MSDFASQLAAETWPLYGVGMSVLVLRFFARIRRIGIKGFCPDDWLMIISAFLYTVLVYTLNRIASGGGSNLYPPEQYPTFSPEEIQERIMGSKIVVISEQAMLCLIYLLKVCMLCMYYRLTNGTSQTRAVLILAGYVALGFVATEIGFFTFCMPFQGYWGMPPPDPQCTTLQRYAIVQACFNLSSDVCMLLIAIPLVLRLNLPLRQKIVLSSVFGMGIFVIIAAILTKVYNLSDVYDTNYMFWYYREASVAIYVSNVPMIWPLLREVFPFLRTAITSAGSRTPGANSRSKGAGKNTTQGSHVLSHKGNFRQSIHELNFVKSVGSTTDANSDEDLSIGRGGRSDVRFTSSRRGGSPASDERVLNNKQSDRFWGKGDIHAEVTIEIERESADLEAQTGRPRRISWDRPTREVRIEGGEKSNF